MGRSQELTSRYWAKPSDTTSGTRNQPRYCLNVSGGATGEQEVWILLSQHLVSKDRALDDIALHVYEEHEHGSVGATLDSRAVTSVRPLHWDLKK